MQSQLARPSNRFRYAWVIVILALLAAFATSLLVESPAHASTAVDDGTGHAGQALSGITVYGLVTENGETKFGSALGKTGGTGEIRVIKVRQGSSIQVAAVTSWTESTAEKVEVPDVVGKTRAEAEEMLENAGFEVRYDESYPDDVVTSQRPAAGAKAEPGSDVELTLKTPEAEKVEVPDVVGKTRAEAEEMLENAGFYVVYGESYPYDVVTSQQPSAGKKAEKGSEVALTLKTPEAEVPDVVGMTLLEATNALGNAGFHPVYTDAASDDVVVSQQPAAGTKAEKGSDVRLTLQAHEEDAQPAETEQAGTQSAEAEPAGTKGVAPRSTAMHAQAESDGEGGMAGAGGDVVLSSFLKWTAEGASGVEPVGLKTSEDKSVVTVEGLMAGEEATVTCALPDNPDGIELAEGLDAESCKVQFKVQVVSADDDAEISQPDSDLGVRIDYIPVPEGMHAYLSAVPNNKVGSSQFNYTWEISTNGGATWSTFMDETVQTLYIMTDNPPSGHIGHQFRVILETGQADSGGAITRAISDPVTIVARPVTIVASDDFSIALDYTPPVAGDYAVFTTHYYNYSESDGKITYVWEMNMGGGWEPIPGAADAPTWSIMTNPVDLSGNTDPPSDSGEINMTYIRVRATTESGKTATSNAQPLTVRTGEISSGDDGQSSVSDGSQSGGDNGQSNVSGEGPAPTEVHVTDSAGATAAVGSVKVLGITSKTYTGKPLVHDITVISGNRVLSPGSDYSVSYKGNVRAGYGRVLVTGKGRYSGISIERPFRIYPAKVTSAKLSKSKLAYTGKAQKPVVTSAKAGSIALRKGDYSVKYSSARSKTAGTYSVTVSGKGNFAGSKRVTYRIVRSANRVAAGKSTVSRTLKAKELKKKALAIALPKAKAKFGKAKWKVAAKDQKGILSLSGNKVKVKKGARKGTYVVKLKPYVTATKNYRGATGKVLTMRVTVG